MCVCVCVRGSATGAASDAVEKKTTFCLEDGETQRSESFGSRVYFCLLNVAALAG